MLNLNFDQEVFAQKEKIEKSFTTLTEVFVSEVFKLSVTDVEKQALIEHASEKDMRQDFLQELINQLNLS